MQRRAKTPVGAAKALAGASDSGSREHNAPNQ